MAADSVDFFALQRLRLHHPRQLGLTCSCISPPSNPVALCKMGKKSVTMLDRIVNRKVEGRKCEPPLKQAATTDFLHRHVCRFDRSDLAVSG